jgi:hypothetical protein
MKEITLENRIMTIIRKENKIDLKTAKRYFRGRSNEKVDNKVMRAVRRMAEDGKIKRIERGVYK